MRGKKLLSISLIIAFMLCSLCFGYTTSANAADYEAFAAKLDKTVYSGNLGAVYTKTETVFRVWAPTSDSVKVKFYKNATSNIYTKLTNMKFNKSTGVWGVRIKGDLKNTYYTYVFRRKGKTYETYDIYAKACAPNGRRSMVVDLSATDPKGWDNDLHVSVDNPTDARIWEVHVGDFSNSETSGVTEKHRGKYLAFTESGTTVGGVAGAAPTCVDYLKQLGVNYVQINPFYDFGSVNENDKTKSDSNYNWGYDPINYNIPEGSYSTDVSKGTTRIIECKKMIQALHKAGIGVIMDVVYNHTYESVKSAFNLTVPNYYYRFKSDGEWSNGSGCGNDTASEHRMFRKYMIDSVKYWAEEYHVDGFRFDLMGLHDVPTMNKIRRVLDTLDGGTKLIMYGEAWKLDTSADEGTVLANQDNVTKLSDRIGAFDDTFRDALKGPAAGAEQGFIQSGANRGNLMTGITGQSDDTTGWAKSPNQCVTYTSCHDNLALWDKLVISEKGNEADYTERYNDLVAMNKLAGAVTYTSQGISFMLAGEEFCRTKQGDENSYKSGKSLNQIDWSNLETFGDVSDYYRGLIKLRQNVPAFTDPTADTVKSMVLVDNLPEGVLAYKLRDSRLGKILMVFNSSKEARSLQSDTVWAQLVNEKEAGIRNLGTVSGKLTIPAVSAAVFVEKESFDAAGLSSDEGKVIVKYTENGNVFKSYAVNDKIGESFSVEPLTRILMNYDIKKRTGTSGTFSDSLRTCTFECQKFDGSITSITFDCIDEATGRTISDTIVMTNRQGQAYETLSIPSVEGYSLDLAKLPANGCGTFGELDSKVQYKYKKKDADDITCKVNIVYMSTDGTILGTDSKSGDLGAPYSTTQIDIEDYTFKSVTDNSTGSFSPTEKNVLYIYTPAAISAETRNFLLICGVVLIVAAASLIYRKRQKSKLMSKLDIG